MNLLEARHLSVISRRGEFEPTLPRRDMLQELNEHRLRTIPGLKAKLTREKKVFQGELSKLASRDKDSVDLTMSYLHKRLAASLIDVGNTMLQNNNFAGFFSHVDMAVGILETTIPYFDVTVHPDENAERVTGVLKKEGVIIIPAQEKNFAEELKDNTTIVKQLLAEDPSGFLLIEESAKRVTTGSERFNQKVTVAWCIPEFVREGTNLAVTFYKGLFPLAEQVLKKK